MAEFSAKTTVGRFVRRRCIRALLSAGSFLAALAPAAGVAAAETPIEIVSRTLIPDDSERVVASPLDERARYRVRIWAPLAEAKQRPAPSPAIFVVDEQWDLGFTAALVRQAEAASPEWGRWVVSVAPVEETTLKTFQGRAWSAEEEAFLAAFLAQTLLPRLKAELGFGEARLVGIGRGANVALRALEQDPATFVTILAKDHSFGPEQLNGLAARVKPAAAESLRPKLVLGWVLGQTFADPAAMALLETLKSKGYAFAWALNQTDASFLEAHLWR